MQSNKKEFPEEIFALYNGVAYPLINVNNKNFQGDLHNTPSSRKRTAEALNFNNSHKDKIKVKKTKEVVDKLLSQKVPELVPESQMYVDLLKLEQKLDATIMRKRFEVQQAIKRPMHRKQKLRIAVSNIFHPIKEPTNDQQCSIPYWELRIEGHLLDDNKKIVSNTKMKRKFSTYFRTIIIELDKDLYGPDDFLIEWHRSATTIETDGFKIKRPGDCNVRCTILLMPDYKPFRFKLDAKLSRLLNFHSQMQTHPAILNAFWVYIKANKLQDKYNCQFINCDKNLAEIFGCKRMKFSEVSQRLKPLLHAPDPILINHSIVNANKSKQTAFYEIDIEIDDSLKDQMNEFLLNTNNSNEIQELDTKIHETINVINQLQTNQEFYQSFAMDPQEFLNHYNISQTRDWKVLTDVAGNSEQERKSEFYTQPWTHEAVSRYISKIVDQNCVEFEEDSEVRKE